MNVTIKITITKDYQLQVKLIDFQNKETIVKLSQEHQFDYYTPSISFDKNFIRICAQNESAIHFMKKWMEQPEDYSTYQIEYQKREYKLLPEMLFTIIINEFMQPVSREYIIENIEYEIPTDDFTANQRMKISLNIINIDDEEIKFNYENQLESLFEILDRKEMIDKIKRMIERAEEIKPEAKEKLQQIDINKEGMHEEDTFNKEIMKLL